MRIRLLGTGAAEGIPGYDCRCSVCTEAALRGGRDLRTRSSLLIDDVLKVDYGPDTYAQKVRFGVDLARIETLLFTHAHEDHFTPTELIWRASNFIQDGEPAELAVYGNAAVGALLEVLCERYRVGSEDFCSRLRMHFTAVEPFQPYEASGYMIHPVLATHDPKQVPLNYLVEREGRSLLIGYDTGWWRDETWEYLDGRRCDCVLMDCTMGDHAEGEHHLGFPDNVRVRDEMERRGIIDGSTRYVLTHISHGGRWLHHELEAHAGAEGMIAAYDGMEIRV